MALINCPECKKEISDKAVSCPSCGYPLQLNKSSLKNVEKKNIAPSRYQPPELQELFQMNRIISDETTQATDEAIKAKGKKTMKGVITLMIILFVGFPLAIILPQIGHEHSGGGSPNVASYIMQGNSLVIANEHSIAGSPNVVSPVSKPERYSWAQYLTKTECDGWGTKGAGYGASDRLAGNYDSGGKKRMATRNISLSDNRLSEIWTCFETGYDTAYYQRY